MQSEDDGLLLGDPRLKNGLAYYPGVMTSQGIVCLGNVVRLNLQTEDGQAYVAFGHLKGLWLWRDQPYIRVQHFAPVHTNLPRTALAYRAEPELGKHAEELLVTTSVADEERPRPPALYTARADSIPKRPPRPASASSSSVASMRRRASA